MEDIIDATYRDVPEISIVPEIIARTKIANMGEFIVDIQQKVRELEAKLVPSTPPEVTEKLHA